jgi:UDP-N-acetylmuramoyl-tripeptide--D-alanyl-D-alanine ligase
MRKFSIADLARIVKASAFSVFSPPFHGGLHEIRDTQYAIRDFTGVSINSRTIKPGDCFFAIPGENFDGHDYVSEAFAKGAVCAVVSKELKKSKLKYCLLKVEDTVKAIGDFAREYRRQTGFKVVAITGSVGKTTTRHITCYVLSKHFRVFQPPKNFNNNIGLPLTLLGADPEHQVVITELGTNHPGEIAYLTGIALPDIAVVTNVYPAHLEGLGNLETIIQEKLSISEGLKPDGVLIINADFDQLTDACRARGIRFVTFGKSAYETDYQAANITYDGFGSHFAINGVDVYLPLPGPGNVENALAACAICNRLGVTIEDFAQTVSTKGGLSPTPMRAELLQIGTLTILNDCYNANPASMENALEILSNLGSTPLEKTNLGTTMLEKRFPTRSTQNRRTVFICGDMAELGQQTQLLHRQLGESIAKAKVQLLLAVGKFAHIAAQAAKEAADSSGHYLQVEYFDDTISACNNLQKFIKNHDIILVKGSRIAKLELVVENLKELFCNSMLETRNECRESRFERRR